MKDSPQLADAHPAVPTPPRPATPTELKFGITITNLREENGKILGSKARAGCEC